MSRNIHLVGNGEAREAAFRGADRVAGKVEESIGPAGLNLGLEKGMTTSNDGKKISKHLSDSTENEFERWGALFQHEGSVKVEQLVKDSTSAYFSLSKGIRKALVPYLPSKSVPIALKPVSELKKQLAEEFKVVCEKLQEDVKRIKTREDLVASALVSVEDEELAEMIGGTQWDLVTKTGDGIIRPQETAEYESSIEQTSGIYMDNGFAQSMLINNPEKESLEIETANVLLTNYVIDSLEPLTGLLIDLKRQNKIWLAIFARAFSQKAMKEISEWGMKGMAIFPINAPYTNQSQVFLDIAAVTGATYITDETKELALINTKDIGYSKRISCGRNDSFIGGAGDEGEAERVKTRVETVEKDLKATNSEFYKDTLRARIAGLKGAYAILKVGSRTESDRKRKFDKCEDAVGAVRNALASGTVKGAGIAFKEVADTLPDTFILKEPLYGIYRQIKNTMPMDYEVPEWCRDPYISLVTALEIAIENSLNMANTMGIDTAPNPRKE
jgi:chaperonin GroEL